MRQKLNPLLINLKLYLVEKSNVLLLLDQSITDSKSQDIFLKCILC